MNFLSGYKTHIAGVALMLKAVVGIILHFVDPANSMAMEFGAAFNDFMTGLGLVGIRFAINK